MADDDTSLESEAIKQIESAVFKKVFFVVLAGAIAFGSWVGIGGVRPDPATGTELKALRDASKVARDELEADMKAYADSGKFTHSDFELEKEKMMAQIEMEEREIVEACHQYVEREIQHAEILLRAEIPPAKTKAKIRALEASAARVDPEFKAVYGGW